MERLIPVKAEPDILPAYRKTPIETLLAYQNLNRPHGVHDKAELLIGMCMDNRKHLRVPENFAYILRSGGGNLRYSEFKVSYAVVIGVAGRSLRERSAKVGGAAVVAAFLGALVTLVAVSSNGPISVRFYEPASGTSLGFPVGFYIDRLSAVMMVLISGVSTIIYLF